MEKEVLELIVAGWIHDIGKLLWRGGENRKNRKYEISHSELLVEFFEEINAPRNWQNIAFLASIHHQSDFRKFSKQLSDKEKFLAWCVYMADNISATERLDDNEYKIQSTKEHPIKNIFSLIFQDTSNKDYMQEKINETYFDASEIEKSKFASFSSSNKIDFKYLKENFVKDFEKFIQQNKEITEKTIYQLDILLQKYFTFVPSDAYKSVPDISLYDHSKTVVAFANILYNFYKGKSGFYNKSTDAVKSEITVSLIGGDFPSIQKYIFNGITKSKNITKRLRARSFFVQLLQEAVLQYVLDKLKLSRANVFINAGGKFVILANENVNLDEIRSNINEFLIENYPGLKFILTSEKASLGEIIGGQDLKKVIKSLFDKLSVFKFKAFDKENYREIFNLKTGKTLCKFCQSNYVDIDETEEIICENCEKEIALGDFLVKTVKDKGISFDYMENGSFKFDLGLKKIGENNWNLLERTFKIYPNKWDFEKVEKGIVKSLNLYVPSKNNNSVKSFEEILEDSRSNYLVMVKGDVDNMSLIFQYGFDYKTAENYSISRILTFSRLLELYFGVYFQKLLEEKFTNVYTIFSGGDDFVFVLGLKDMKSLLIEIYNNFHDFTKNDRIHFSTGLALFKDKTPIKSVYKLAEDLLSKAKSKSKEKMAKLVDKEGELQVLKYFGICFAEDTNYVVLNNYNNVENVFNLDWIKEIKEEKSGLLYKLYQSLKDSLEYLKDKQYADYILIGSRILYMLKRNLNQEQFEKVWANLESLFKNINVKNEEKISLLLLKLSYAIYLDRK